MIRSAFEIDAGAASTGELSHAAALPCLALIATRGSKTLSCRSFSSPRQSVQKFEIFGDALPMPSISGAHHEGTARKLSDHFARIQPTSQRHCVWVQGLSSLEHRGGVGAIAGLEVIPSTISDRWLGRPKSRDRKMETSKILRQGQKIELGN